MFIISCVIIGAGVGWLVSSAINVAFQGAERRRMHLATVGFAIVLLCFTISGARVFGG